MISCGFEPLMIPRLSLRAAHHHSKNTFSSWNLKKKVSGLPELSFKNVLKGENFLLRFSFPVLFLPRIPPSLSNQTVGEMEKKINKKWEKKTERKKEIKWWKRKLRNGPQSLPHLGILWLAAKNKYPPKQTSYFNMKQKMKVTLLGFFLLTQSTHHIILPSIVTEGLIRQTEMTEKQINVYKKCQRKKMWSLNPRCEFYS